MTQYEKSASTLELPAILELLARKAVSEAAKERALALSPAMEPVILSSRNLFVMSELKSPSMQVFSLPLPSPAA